jgi:hypothetical protein
VREEEVGIRGYMANWGAAWRAAPLASVSAWLFPLVLMKESV